jgi:predicted permease
MHRALIVLHRVLAGLLLPRAFRAEFGDELALSVEARVESARGARKWAVAFLELLDLGRTAAREWRRVLTSAVSSAASGASIDLKIALRSLARDRTTTAIAVSTIAIAIGASTAVYAVLDGVLLRPLGYPAEARIVRVAIAARPESGATEGPFSPPGYRLLVNDTRAFDAVGSAGVVQRPLYGDGPAEAVDVALVTVGVFDVIGVEPLLGRFPTRAEDVPGGPAITLISHALWQNRYGSDPLVLGRTIQLGPEAYEVIGVMPPMYDFPTPDTDAWVMRRLDPASDDFRRHFLTVFARLAHGVTLEEAKSDTERLIAGFPELGYGAQWFEDIFTGEAIVRPLKEQIVGKARGPIVVALGTVVLLLVVAYANVANLLMVRAESRRDERALKGALGAGGTQLLRYSLVESALLMGPGTILGIAFAAGGTRALVAIAPAAIPRLQEIQLGTSVLLLVTVVALGSAFLFALLPAALSGHGQHDVFRRIGRGTFVRKGPSRLQDALTVGQVALTVMLLASAGLMIRTFSELRAIDPGFRPENVLTFRLSPSPAKYPGPEFSARFYDELLKRIRELPGVSEAGAVMELPVTGGGGLMNLTLGGITGIGYSTGRATPGYFEAMGIPVIAGRSFIPEDHAERLGSVLISESVQRALWPGESALGKRVEGWGAPATIVGVVADVHQKDLKSPPEHTIYKPLLDSVGGGGLSLAVVVRGVDDPRALIETLRGVVAEMDADLPLSEVRTMDSIVGDTMSRTTFTMTLITLAAGIALFLAAIGIYGVLSFVASRRRREMAVRMAVGAAQSRVLTGVLAHGLQLAVAGLLVGTAAAVALGRGMRSLLAEVRPLDAATLGGVALILLLASAVASLAPAINSARTPPADALRDEV